MTEVLEEEVVIEYSCGYEPEHTHVLPGDWHFGGPDGLDPRVDERWQPSVYVYFDSNISPIHVTVLPFCDDEAIDRFTEVASYGPGFNPVWLQVRRPDGTSQMLPVEYDKATDSVYDKD